MLLDALPSFVNSPHLTRQADIQRWALDQLKSELLEPLPGGMLVANHLLHLMLVQMLRHHLTTLSPTCQPDGSQRCQIAGFVQQFARCTPTRGATGRWTNSLVLPGFLARSLLSGSRRSPAKHR